MNTIHDRRSVIDEIAESEKETSALREHVQEIAEGRAFKGSERCKKFLTYVVEQAISGHADVLKERVIGVEVFGLPPSYDSKDEAVVRVTASDVRKRLLQHYGKDGAESRFHICLPVGCYIPEVSRVDGVRGNKIDFLKPHRAPLTAKSSQAVKQESASYASAKLEQSGSSVAMPFTRAPFQSWRTFAVLVALAILILAALNVALWSFVRASSSRAKVLPVSILPWSTLFAPPHTIRLITSDVDIVRIQNLFGHRITVSDYANRNYSSEFNHLPSSEKADLGDLLRENRTATHDAQIAALVAELAGANAHQIYVEGARDVQLSEFKADDSFILLGSPFSDPWYYLFSDQLDFQFAASGKDGLGTETIVNVRPAPNEQSIYTPTAGGDATGDQYAIAAFVGNPGQHGHVLLLAGVSGEGTTAAAKLMTDLPRLSTALEKCGISPSGPLKHFEFLLRVNTMAGIPNQFEIVTCHILK